MLVNARLISNVPGRKTDFRSYDHRGHWNGHRFSPYQRARPGFFRVSRRKPPLKKMGNLGPAYGSPLAIFSSYKILVFRFVGSSSPDKPKNQSFQPLSLRPLRLCGSILFPLPRLTEIPDPEDLSQPPRRAPSLLFGGSFRRGSGHRQPYLPEEGIPN